MLGPGKFLLIGFSLGRYFEMPGVYTVRWSGDGFKAAGLVIRVLPRPH